MAQNNVLHIMTAADILSGIKKGLSGVYLFCGPEDYMLLLCLQRAKEKISGGDETNETFAYTRIDGKRDKGDDQGDGKLNFGELSAAADTVPMFCEKRLIEVRGVDYHKMSQSESDAFCSLLDELAQNESLVVIFNVREDEIDLGTIPKKPSAFLQKLAPYINIVYFETQSPVKLAAWALRHFNAHGVSAAPAQCYEMIQRCGNSMRLLAFEIDKLCLYVLASGRQEVLAQDIVSVCSVYNPEMLPFAVSNAILKGDRDALSVAYFEMKFKKTRPEQILAQISAVWCDLQTVMGLSEAGESKKSIAYGLGMHEFRVGKYLEAGNKIPREKIAYAVRLCGESDRKIKNSSLDAYIVIECLIGLI